MAPYKTPVRAIRGNFRDAYPSICACAKDLGLQQSHISEVLSGKRKQHKGFTFVALKGE